MFFGRRVANLCVALVVGIMTWGVVGGVSATPLLSAAGSPTTTIALSDTTTTTVKANTTTTTVKSDTTTTTITNRDLCPNIDGVQTTIPSGMFVNARGDCVPRVVDLCPNIAGVQVTVPAGMFVNARGDCVKIVDLCSNIPGIQATVPSGMFRTVNGKCFPRLVDVIVIGPNPAVSPCVIGATGPGGGIVFYDAGSHQPWGQCLEAAPNTWNGGTTYPIAPWGCQGLNVLGALGTTPGKGQANTTAIVNACLTTGIAARLADNLVFGGKSDWFLPSISDLGEMQQVLGLSSLFWSSTQSGPNKAYDSSNTDLKSSMRRVRPVRSFG